VFVSLVHAQVLQKAVPFSQETLGSLDSVSQPHTYLVGTYCWLRNEDPSELVEYMLPGMLPFCGSMPGGIA
jgi:hypothetical protein